MISPVRKQTAVSFWNVYVFINLFPGVTCLSS